MRNYDIKGYRVLNEACLIEEYKRNYNADLVEDYGFVHGKNLRPTYNDYADFVAAREHTDNEAVQNLFAEPFVLDTDEEECVMGNSDACKEFFQACNLDVDVSFVFILPLTALRSYLQFSVLEICFFRYRSVQTGALLSLPLYL